jgi:hypothetical protein
MVKRKRGRPVGSTKKLVVTPVSDFEKTLDGWDRMDAEASKVDVTDLCQKLQAALAKSYVDAEELERTIAYLHSEISARDVVIRYLESKIK